MVTFLCSDRPVTDLATAADELRGRKPGTAARLRRQRLEVELADLAARMRGASEGTEMISSPVATLATARATAARDAAATLLNGTELVLRTDCATVSADGHVLDIGSGVEWRELLARQQSE